jgi:pimeloyl-ACP methyl ester carboxylesterase
MQVRINQIVLSYVEHGHGMPLVALHGAGVDHRELEAAIEALGTGAGYRRIYPDLPGMGASTADGLSSNDEVVTLLVDFLQQLGAGPVLLLGHSYGGYLARGVAARRPELVRGLALLCPLAEHTGQVPDQKVVHQDPAASDELEPEHRQGFDEYFVVRTPATARRYRDHVLPGMALVDQAVLGRLVADWPIDLGTGPFAGPTLIVAGRQDSTVGYADAIGLLERYPHATLAVLDGAGHALIHERPELLAPLLAGWLDRARPNAGLVYGLT